MMTLENIRLYQHILTTVEILNLHSQIFKKYLVVLHFPVKEEIKIFINIQATTTIFRFSRKSEGKPDY